MAPAMARGWAGTRRPTAPSTMRQVWPTSVATMALPEAIASSKLELPRFSWRWQETKTRDAGEERGQVGDVAPLHRPVQAQLPQVAVDGGSLLPLAHQGEAGPGVSLAHPGDGVQIEQGSLLRMEAGGEGDQGLLLGGGREAGHVGEVVQQDGAGDGPGATAARLSISSALQTTRASARATA